MCFFSLTVFFLQICIINGGGYCHLTSTLANVAILAAIGQFLLLTKNSDGDEYKEMKV